MSTRSLLEADAFAATLPPALTRLLRDESERGAPLSAALRAANVLRPDEVALLEAGESSGETPAALRGIVAAIERRIADRRALLRAVGYPAFMLCCAGVILPIPLLVTCGPAAYFARAIWVPLIVAALAFIALVWLPRVPPTDPRRAALAKLARLTPGLGAAVRRQDSATFARVLGRAVGAGIPIVAALESAGASSGDASMRRAMTTATARIRRGATLSAALEGAPTVTPTLRAAIAQGELTGTLDTALTRFADREDDEARRGLQVVIRVFGAVVFTGVVLFVGWQIISGFIGVVETIERAIDV